jgi:hypothetical protein
MMKTIGSFAASALLLALTLPGPAGAADNKHTDGLTNATPQITDISSRHRRWHRPRVVYRHGYRYRYPRYRYYPYYGAYAYAPYPYYRYYRPRYYRPGVSFHFGF